MRNQPWSWLCRRTAPAHLIPSPHRRCPHRGTQPRLLRLQRHQHHAVTVRLLQLQQHSRCVRLHASCALACGTNKEPYKRSPQEHEAAPLAPPPPAAAPRSLAAAMTSPQSCPPQNAASRVPGHRRVSDSAKTQPKAEQCRSCRSQLPPPPVGEGGTGHGAACHRSSSICSPWCTHTAPPLPRSRP